MKKKTALLLAFIMVFALLPMNVFGNTPANANTVTQRLGTDAAFVARPATFHLDYSLFAAQNPNQFRFVVEVHGHDGNLINVNATSLPVTLSGPAGNVVPDGGGSRNLQVHQVFGTRTGDIDGGPPPADQWHRAVEFEILGGVLPVATTTGTGLLSITLPISAFNSNATASLRVYRDQGGVWAPVATPISEQSIVQAAAARNLRITTGDPVTFAHELRVPQLRIEEVNGRVIGTSQWTGAFVAVELTAPVGYEWADRGFNVTTRNRTFVTNSDGYVTGTDAWVGWRTRGVTEAGVPIPYRHVAVVFIPSGRIGDVVLDQLNINNLWLRPSDLDRVRPGAVNIDIRVGGSVAANSVTATQIIQDSLEAPLWLTGNNDTVDNDVHPDNNRDGRNATNVHVGTREGVNMTFRAMPGDDGLPELRSGLLFGPAIDRGEVTTASVVLSELVPASWQSNAFTDTEFYFGEGVQILGARVRAYYGDAEWYAGRRLVETWEEMFTAADLGILSTDITRRGGNDWNNYEGGRVRMTPSTLQIFLPLNPSHNRPRLYNLEVEFYLSIVAGYEATFGDEIEVGIRGASLANLPASDRTAVVATVVDPISVRLDGEVGQIITSGQVQAPTQIAPFANIVITETEVGMLQRGEVLNVFAVAIPEGVVGTANLREAVVTVDNASGLEVRVEQAPNNGLSITVLRESFGNTPATITLSNNHFMGVVLPGVEYHVAVQSGAFGVTANTFRTTTLAPGIFNQFGYAVEILEWAGFDGGAQDTVVTPGPGQPGDGVTGPGQGVVGRPGGFAAPQNLVAGQLVPTVQAAGNVTNVDPIINAAGVNFVANRVFANFIGADIHWVGSTQEVTVVGYDAEGVRTTVVLTIGQTRATINGFPVDIADFSRDPVTGTGSGPHGTIAPFMANGSSYLPVRFLVRAFGMDTDLLWQQGVPGVTLGW